MSTHDTHALDLLMRLAYEWAEVLGHVIPTLPEPMREESVRKITEAFKVVTEEVQQILIGVPDYRALVKQRHRREMIAKYVIWRAVPENKNKKIKEACEELGMSYSALRTAISRYGVKKVRKHIARIYKALTDEDWFTPVYIEFLFRSIKEGEKEGDRRKTLLSSAELENVLDRAERRYGLKPRRGRPPKRRP